jgi:tetratricopeptide (TPR) repeat protein
MFMATTVWNNGIKLTLRSAALGATIVLAQNVLYQLDSRFDFGLVVDGIAVAQEKSTEKTRKTPALRNEVYEQLSKAQELSEAGNINEAVKVLNALRDSQGKRALNSYELANMYNFYAFIYYQQEQYPKTIEAYKNVLKQPDLPVAMETSTYYSLAQLYFVVEDYPNAVNYLNKWFKVAENPQPDAYVLLAQAYYQTKQYDLALRNVEKAMTLAKQKGKDPKENWFLLQRVLYYDKGDMQKVSKVLEELLRRWPKKEYWTQASGIYGELKNDKRQMVAMETAYVAGMLNREQELLNMAYLYLGSDTPYRAAKVVETGLQKKQIPETSKNYELLGNSLRAAQELDRAIPALAKAAELSDQGELWARLANTYLDNDDFSNAAKAARTALQMGGLRRTDSTRIVLGMALFNLDNLDDARQQFVLAGKDERSAKMAEDWIKYLDNELARRESLKDGLS